MTTCVIQARTGSTRLPGKVLADVGGRPMLALMLHRLRHLEATNLVVATTDLARDDAVARVAEGTGVAVVRGPEADVLARFVLAVDRYPSDTVVRMTADCPLADPALVASAMQLQAATGAAYVSNSLVRTFPDGLDVEVMTSEALRAAATEAADLVEREHVTPFIYRRPERFPLASLRSGLLLGDERWTIDTPDDLEWLRAVVPRLASDDAGWLDVLDVAGRRSVVASDRLRLRPATEADVAIVAGTEPGLVPGLTDPSSRIWIAELGGAEQLRLRIDVTCGSAALSVEPRDPDGEVMADAVQLLRRALAADCQVRELWLGGDGVTAAGRGALSAAGFQERDDGVLRLPVWGGPAPSPA